MTLKVQHYVHCPVENHEMTVAQLSDFLLAILAQHDAEFAPATIRFPQGFRVDYVSDEQETVMP